MDDLISVIINVYNGEKYIAKCLESVLNQTYRNLEVLIVNDGSTDRTLDICEKYEDDRIKIITTKNMGLSNSRNVGIDNSKGEYLYFVDSDDYIEIDTIEYLYGLVKKFNVKMASGKPFEIYNYDCKVKNKKEKVEIVSNVEMLKRLLLSIDRIGTTWNKLMKKEIFENIRFEDRIINDVVITYKTFLAVDKIAYSNQMKYYYYRHDDSIMGQNKTDRSIDLYKASLERYENIKKIYPKLVENRICIDWIIMTLYLNNDEKIIEFLEEQNAFKLFKKMFTIRVLFTKTKFKDKIKIILFRINPKLCRLSSKNYLKMKNKKSPA